MAQNVGVRGLHDLRRALAAMDKTLARDLSSKLKDAAGIVAAAAREKAPEGTRPIPLKRRPRKRMRDTIVPFAKTSVAGIRAGAVAPDGFPYPRRIEWETGGQPFMRPALEEKAPEVEDAVARLLEDLADIWEAR